MKSISFAKLVTLGCFALMLPVACGDDDDDSPGPSKGGSSGSGGEAGQPTAGGEGGAPTGTVIPGTSKTKETIECSTSCTSTNTAIGLYLKPCCTPEAQGNLCGVDSGFLTLLGTDLKGACLPKVGPAEVDPACPTSPKTPVTVNGTTVEVDGFAGCCLPTGQCGFAVDAIKAAALGVVTQPNLGCVSGAAFGVTDLPSCGGGEGGTGGVGGAGGSPSGDAGAPIVGGGGAGGAP